METKKPRVEMVELLIQLEEALSKLYEAFAEKFSSLESFWRGLSADELIHADWIRELLTRAEDGTVLQNENRFAAEAVRTSLHYTIDELVAARMDDVPLIEALSRAMSAEESLLEKKYFFDEVYDFVWVKGCILVAHIARFIDTWIVDLIFDLAASIIERLAAFSGLILDNHGVDGMVNGVAKTSMDFSDVVRGPQTGRIRHYVLFAATVATVVLVLIVWRGLEPGGSVEAAAVVGSVGG